MKSSLLPLNPGGPSATTLQALSEYCASADSPTASTLSPRDLEYTLATEFPPHLSASIYGKSWDKAPQHPHAVKPLPDTSHGVNSGGSLIIGPNVSHFLNSVAQYLNSPSHGLPASPNFRRSPLWDRNFGCDVSTYSTNTSSRRITPLSPLVLHPPSSPTMDVELTSDALPTTRTSPTSCMRAAPSTGTSRYPGLGYGFPRPLRDVSRTPSRRFTSGRTGTSRRTRTISNVLSASYSHTILHPVPGIKRYPDMDSEGPAHRPERSVLGHLRVAASLVRRLAVNSRERGQKRKAERV
ncbi:hypothetical protein B0H16DRAFT_1470495 [Mycena metata]|uniref:Uncharacterized protein n=1 Tax=Mycena metata TaxID=1033252 RepID=A0AAD7HW86_9AGAR|nr:hypothetical protein B0H16DRAFT_1470495 [Mycena metata]